MCFEAIIILEITYTHTYVYTYINIYTYIFSPKFDNDKTVCANLRIKKDIKLILLLSTYLDIYYGNELKNIILNMLLC